MHVHVYRVEGQAEVDIPTADEEEARRLALAKVKDLAFGVPDANYIAMTFNETEGG